MTKKEISKYIGFVFKKMRSSIVLDVVAFLALRFTLGVTRELVYLYILLLLFLGISIEMLTVVFFCIAIALYVLGGWVEANNYFSYVYIGMILSVVKYFYRAVKDRKSHQ